jgi:biotin carboxyl carrier protein
MDLEQLKKILDLVREHELSELELESEGLRLTVRKEIATPSPATFVPAGSSSPASNIATGLSGSSSSRTPSATTTVPLGVGAGSGGSVGSPGPAGSGGADVAGIGAHGSVEEIGHSEVELAVVKSPIVGTFYRATEPSAPPLVEVGSIVRKGQVLCIIEAMKLMNEIDSEYDGEVTNVYVENGQPVQYGERLFAIKVR